MATPGMKKQIAGNMVLAAYEKASGSELGPRHDWPKEREADYMKWCEDRVLEWRERVESLGYSWPCYCVGSVGTGTQTYHEWLFEKVGL